MKKLVLMVAMVAMVVIAAAPAFAQVGLPSSDGSITQPFSERRITSGKSSPTFDVSNTGNNANLCPTGEQVGQTGNLANEQGVDQYRTGTDSIDFTGPDISVTPDVSGTCTQSIQKKVAAPTPQPTPPSPSPSPSAGPSAGGGAAPRLLPATGGMSGSVASLLGLGAGALLVGGGLIARRIIR